MRFAGKEKDMNAEPVYKRRAENPLLPSGVKWLP